ncbi:N-terminal methylation site-containing protein [Pseudidiomarina maritima]|uniref:Type II secretion system protein H n=1 Tax=Pseudidiomarina maritima TaxID=519453 RepID=A0A1I6GQ56_9GAMM|nr:GspH/FimT family protein [Pseudidiomarina maritima]SFR44375.1 N-terminal methylation site-containing protein [Pseudidiomarina maritima]
MRQGFTLLELIITLLILSIVLGWGVPATIEMARTMRLQGAAQDTYGLLQYARSDALSSGENRFVVWDDENGEWCAAVADNNDCDCLTEDCSIDGVLRQINGSEYSGVTMASATFSSGEYTRFDALRGLAEGNAGTVSYQLRDSSSAVEREVRVIVSTLGRLRYCQVGGVGSYPAC